MLGNSVKVITKNLGTAFLERCVAWEIGGDFLFSLKMEESMGLYFLATESPSATVYVPSTAANATQVCPFLL